MIFKPELVEKILVGEKTETRRKANPDGSQRYKPGRTYAVQPGRTEKGVDRTWVPRRRPRPAPNPPLTRRVPPSQRARRGANRAVAVLLARIPKSFAGRRLGGICRAATNARLLAPD